MSLLGDQGVELFLWHNAVLVQIGTLNHLLEDIIVSELSQVLGHLSQVFQSNET